MPEAMMRISGEKRKSLPRRFNFTVQQLRGLKVPAGKDRLWVFDTRVPRLTYMATRTGASSFYWYGKVNGRPQRYRLGDGTLSIEQARKLAAGVLGKVAQGADPQAERRKVRAEMTFKELFDWYITQHAKAHKRTWEDDQAQYDRHLADLGSRRFTSITRADVSSLHAKVGKTAPFAANRVLALVSTVFNKARLLGYDGPNPAEGVPRFREGQRERFLQADELPRFFGALKTVDQDWRDFFTLALLTGARRGNLQMMEWPEVNFDIALWTINPAKMKAGRTMVIPLVPEALDILKRRYAERTTHPEGKPAYVFPSYGKSGHIKEPKTAWKRVCDAAGLADLRLHDLRRTLGSWQAATGASLPVIGKSLGHSQAQTTQIYARLNTDPVRQSIGTAVDAMMNISKQK